MARRYKGKKIPEIVRVTPLPDYRLKLELTSGSLLILNMAEQLNQVRYAPLKDVDREMVFLSPLPALGHFSSPFWKGRSIQSMFMNAMMEKPT